jgi:7,8-dihydropterin-6-yl-methyl-4-(beta-D-ribofuranosyl)aminobenzene 5'-phosphate synthase
MTDRLGSVSLDTVVGVSITILMDNISDLLAAGGPGIIRPALLGGQTVDAGVFAAPDVVRAEHGFSALVTAHTPGGERRILFDTGISPDGMTDNMRRLDVDPKDVESVVMSHGHLDHTGGLIGFVQAVGRGNVPLLIHPDFWLERRLSVPGRAICRPPADERSRTADTSSPRSAIRACCWQTRSS